MMTTKKNLLVMMALLGPPSAAIVMAFVAPSVVSQQRQLTTTTMPPATTMHAVLFSSFAQPYNQTSPSPPSSTASTRAAPKKKTTTTMTKKVAKKGKTTTKVATAKTTHPVTTATNDKVASVLGQNIFAEADWVKLAVQTTMALAGAWLAYTGLVWVWTTTTAFVVHTVQAAALAVVQLLGQGVLMTLAVVWNVFAVAFPWILAVTLWIGAVFGQVLLPLVQDVYHHLSVQPVVHDVVTHVSTVLKDVLHM